MTKKWMLIAVVVFIMIGIAGCGKSEDEKSDEDASSKEEYVKNDNVTQAPTVAPTVEPTKTPTQEPTVESTVTPTIKPTVKSTKEPTQRPVVATKPTVKPTKTIQPTVVPTKTKKPPVKQTAKPSKSPSTRKPVVGDGYVDPYTGKWFESEEACKEWWKEEIAKQTPTPVPRTETEKTESKYYKRKGIFKLVYDEDGNLDIRKSIYGLEENDFDIEDGDFFRSKEISEAFHKYSNIYNPSRMGIRHLQGEAYVEGYPYYDIRDFMFTTYIFDKNGYAYGEECFYFNEKFEIVKGEHPNYKYDMGGGVIPNLKVSPDALIENNPNHYKKDIIKFVYNDDGSPNIKESIIGENVDFIECCDFIRETKDVKGIVAEIEENYPGLSYSSSLSQRLDIYPKYYYDIRDYEISFTVNEIETTYYWNEKFNFVERK